MFPSSELQFGLCHQRNITVNIRVPLPAYLFLCGKVNRSEIYGNTGSTTMTLNILFFYYNLVPFQFLFTFPLFLSLKPASCFFYRFLFLLLMCVFVACSSLWDLPDAFHMETYYFFLSFYDYLKYWTYSLLQQTIWCSGNYCNYFFYIFFSYLLTCASCFMSFLYWTSNYFILFVTIFFLFILDFRNSLLEYVRHTQEVKLNCENQVPHVHQSL